MKLFLLAGVAAVSVSVVGAAESAAIAPKFLMTATEPDAVQMVFDKGVACAAEDGRFVMSVEPNAGAWPGFAVRPKTADVWDLSPWGHVEVELTNPGTEPLSVGLRVDNPGDWKAQPWNAENIYLKPGERKTGKVIFGYQYGFQKGFKLNPAKVSQVKIFLNGDKPVARRLVLGDIVAAGASGEKPTVDPHRVAVKPKDGILPGTPLAVSVLQTGAFAALKPAAGFWNLGDWLKVTAVVRNTGRTSVTPRMAVDSSGGKLDGVCAKALKPGETGMLEVSFLASEPWFAKGDGKDVKPTGGVRFESHRVKAVNFTALETGVAFEVVSVRAEKIVAKPPAWLGTRPPVPGTWRQTLAEEFDDGKLNETIWSPYSANYWDKRTHFSNDNIVFKDGKVHLRYEKKTGFVNDDPSTGKTTDHACGILDSYDRWTQLYGYFEARMKLPTKPGLWSAFWTMPDRGPTGGPERWRRNSTHNGGMEFDIMEHLTAWGPYRFNIACHWDGYEKDHRAIGTTVYLPADNEGYITVGLLWLPGVYAIYGNGTELARWESPRVADVPAHIFFYMVSGGWANEPLDDDELPDEFVIDWFRVWQLES